MPTRAKRSLEQSDDSIVLPKLLTADQKPKFELEMLRLDSEVQDRCDEMEAYMGILETQLNNKFQTAMRRIPAKIRKMTMDDFVTTYGGNIDTVITQTMNSAKKDLEHFVQNTYTPRQVAKQEARVTRASARKARELAEKESHAFEVPATPRGVPQTAAKTRTRSKIATVGLQPHYVPTPMATGRVTRSHRYEQAINTVANRVDLLLEKLST